MTSTPEDIEALAAGLTEAQRRALLLIPIGGELKWDALPKPRLRPVVFYLLTRKLLVTWRIASEHPYGRVDYYSLTPRGLALRAHLTKETGNG